MLCSLPHCCLAGSSSRALNHFWDKKKKYFKWAEKFFSTLLRSFISKGIDNSTYCAPCLVENEYVIHQKYIHLLHFWIFILDSKMLGLLNLNILYYYLSPAGLLAIQIKLGIWGIWVSSAGETKRSGDKLCWVFCWFLRELCRVCQSWQRKGAQPFDASVHYSSSMQFSWPYFLDWLSPFLVFLKTTSLLNKAGVFYISV